MKLKKTIFLIICIIIATFLPAITLAKQQIDWKYIETQHFTVIYHEEVKKQAYQSAQIAEEVFNSLSTFTGFKLYRKIAIVITAEEDIANGGAVPRDLIMIWANPFNLSTRVDGEWLKNRITHELTHILQTEATFGATYRVHKLTGGSTFLGLPPNAYQPRWFLEGVAQYGSYIHGFDDLDRKREMILEQKIQSNDFFTNAETIWGRSAIGGESMYNFGFGFIEFLMRRYGEDTFIQIQQKQNSMYYMGLDAIFRGIYGKSLNALVEEWKSELRMRFPIRLERDPALPIERKPTQAEWSQPLVTPEGGLIFTESHFDRPSVKLYYWHPKQGLTVLKDSPLLALTRLSLSKDGQKLLYTAYNYQGTFIRWDLYEMDLRTHVTRRITTDSRIIQGVHFKDGYILVKNDWGKFHLYYMYGDQMTQITDTDYNFVIKDLALSPDETHLVLNFNYNGQKGLAIMSTNTWKFEQIYLPPDGGDWILGDFTDNNSITLSWDRLDHYDLYQMNLKTGVISRLTDTREDILDPTVRVVNNQSYWFGQIFGSTGFTIASGLTQLYETLIIIPVSLDFLPAPTPKIYLYDSGEYQHLAQLRSDLLVPYFKPGEDELKLGFSQYLTEPLQELSILYDVSWDFEQNELSLNLDSTWSGTNPGFGVSLQVNGWNILAGLTENYQLFPYFASATQVFYLADGLAFDQLQLQFGRHWISKNSGSTVLNANYYPDNGIDGVGYDLILQHTQNFPIGYQGDSVLSQTVLGYAGGKNRFRWGDLDSGLMWVYPTQNFATKMVVQKLRYQKTLLDLSANLTNFLQTGRIYGNIFGEYGLFLDGNRITSANMAGIGLELETQIFNLLPIQHQLSVAVNSAGDKRFNYSINAPF